MKSALAFLSVAPPLLLLGAFWANPATEALALVLVAAFPVALMALGASRREGLGRLGPGFLLLAAWLLAAMLAMHALQGRVLDGPRLLGLPLATAIQLFGVGLLPLPFVCAAHALSFDRGGSLGEQLAELRRRFGRHRPPEA